MAAAALDGLPTDSDLRKQLPHMWVNWLRRAMSCPDKRRTLAHLDVSGEITSESHQTANQTMASIARLLERIREHGAMHDVPLEFVVALMSALTDMTIDFMICDPANADTHCMAGFDALWRMVA